MVKKLAIALIVTCSFATGTIANEPFKSPEARRALRTYNGKIKEASKEFEEKKEQRGKRMLRICAPRLSRH
jgi:hypothetical protein